MSSHRGMIAPPAVPELRLDEILERQFFLLQLRITDEKTRTHYRRAIRYYGEMLQRPALLSDLRDEYLAAFLNWLARTRNNQAATVNTSHKCICAFWRWCRDRGLISTGPTVCKVKLPRRAPRALSATEFTRLITTARMMPGSICGYPASVFWLTVFQLVLNCGMRQSELLSVRWDFINWDTGWMTVPAELRKGKAEDMVYALWPETLKWLREMPKIGPQILNWGDRHHTAYFKLWNKLLEMSGMPPSRQLKTQALRRTFATIIDSFGGDASKALGHASPEMARKHYIDPTGREAAGEADVIPDNWRPLKIVGGGE